VAVAPDVTRAHVESELSEVREWADRHRWSIEWRPEELLLEVSMSSEIDKEAYVLEASLQDYRALPPVFELRHPATGERGTHRCYPKGGLGYFHSKPVLCAPWNRKAYTALGGPHSDWVMAQWETYRPNHARLGDILALIQQLLDDRASYKGRMAR